MIPRHLDWAFQEGRSVRTAGGRGLTVRRRLGDLVLPTGRMVLGLESPPSHPVNVPSSVRPAVPSGRYPVWACLAEHPRGHRSVAFVTVEFRPVPPARWEGAGKFFTDSGTGCLMDEACLNRPAGGDAPWFKSWEDWDALKRGVFGGGDCSLVLDPASGANAIVFKAFDWEYPCFLGRGPDGQAVCLVVDGRWHRWWEWGVRTWLVWPLRC
jgi:hypothetical protein